MRGRCEVGFKYRICINNQYADRVCAWLRDADGTLMCMRTFPSAVGATAYGAGLVDALTSLPETVEEDIKIDVVL